MWQCVVLVAVFVVARILARKLSPGAYAWWPLLALALIGWYPVARNLVAGQLDLVLLGVVLTDLLLLRGTRAHGVLVGVAAGIKLTPAGYLLLLVLARDWRSALRLIGTAAATALLAWLILPEASAQFWGNLTEITSRSGNQSQALSQSWAAFVARMQHTPEGMVSGGGTYVWLALVALTVVIGALAIRRALAQQEWLLAIGVNAVVNLLISPLSTMHHWVASLPLFTALIWWSFGARRPVWLAWVALGVVLTGLPSWWYLGGATGWGVVRGIAGSALVFWAFSTLVLVARRAKDAG